MGSFPEVEIPSYDEKQFEVMNKARLRMAPVKTAFRLHAAVTVNNWAILHGGRVFNRMRDDVLGNELYIYNSSVSRWYQAKINNPSKFVVKRFGHTISSINGKLYLLGGAFSDNEDCIGQIVQLQFHQSDI